MTKSVFGCVYTVVALSLLSFTGCYSTVEVGDSSADKAIAIDWVEPPCAEPGSDAGYIEGNGFGAKNVTVTVGGIEAQVLAATGKDASFVVPEGLPPGPIEVVVMNPGGRIATIQWVVCGFDCSAIDCTSDNECVEDGTCDPATGMCIDGDYQPAGTACGDGDVCDDQGNCVECNDATQCTEDDNDCTAASCIDGACTNDPVANGTSCGIDGVCDAGACRERSWGTPVLVSPGQPQLSQATETRVVADHNGNVVVVWSRIEGTLDSLWSNSYTSGVGWGTPELIESGENGITDLELAVDPGGNVTAIWRRYQNFTYELLTSRYTSGVGWGPLELMDQSLHVGRDPQLAVGPNGQVIAVWQKYNATIPETRDIWANRHTPGVGWGAPELVVSSTAYPDYPRLAVDPNGFVTVAWHQSPDNSGGNRTIWVNHFTPGVGWGTAALIDTPDVAVFPRLVADSNGYVTLAWGQQSLPLLDLWANRYTPGVGWGTAELIETNDTNAFIPRLVVDADGVVTAIWAQENSLSGPTLRSVWANRYTPGVGWGTAELIETDDEHDVPGPAIAVAVDPNGFVSVVWQQSWQVQGTFVVKRTWANHYTPGVGWGVAEVIGIDAPGDDVPQVAADHNGVATAVWIQRSNGGSGPLSVFANRYE